MISCCCVVWNFEWFLIFKFSWGGIFYGFVIVDDYVCLLFSIFFLLEIYNMCKIKIVEVVSKLNIRFKWGKKIKKIFINMNSIFN